MGCVELMELEKQRVTKELDLIKQDLLENINKALDNKDKNTFIKLSRSYNDLEVLQNVQFV